MKLLNEIIDLLMNESGSLNEALLKTKVLLHEIGQTNLVGWVNSELAGYADDAALPPYRVLQARVYGNITNGYYTYPKRPLMVNHLRKEYGDAFDVAKMSEAIGVLEQVVASSTPEGGMFSQLGLHGDRLLSEPFTHGYRVEGSYSHIGIGQVQQILIDVRSRLLDFVLNLRDEVGVGASDDDIKEKANNLDIATMFDKALFGNNNTFGDNTTFVVGNGNLQQVTNTSIKNDVAALASELRKNGVADEDIKALNTAIAQDPAPIAAGQYGPAVKAWMTNMFTKAVDTSWKISISAAGGVLAGAIKNYYGI